jgi:hypothetical protein
MDVVEVGRISAWRLMTKPTSERSAWQSSSQGKASGQSADLIFSALLPRLPDGIALPPAPKLHHPSGTPKAVDEAIDRMMARLAPDLAKHLASLEGRNFGEEGNAEFAKCLTRMLRRLGFGVACGCGKPAVALRYYFSGHSSVFKFEHTPSIRHGGGIAIPKLTLIPNTDA